MIKLRFAKSARRIVALELAAVGVKPVPGRQVSKVAIPSFDGLSKATIQFVAGPNEIRFDGLHIPHQCAQLPKFRWCELNRSKSSVLDGGWDYVGF